jgi:branched-chain amino acid transport system permease protein
MDSFVQHLMDGLSLGVIYALFAMACSLASCAGRWIAVANAAAALFGVAVSLAVLSASATLGVRFEFLAMLIAFTTAVAAGSAFGGVIGANLDIFVPRQRGLLPLIFPAGLVIIAAAALGFADQLPATNYLRPSATSLLAFGIAGLFNASILPEKLAVITAGAALFGIVLPVICRARFGRKFRAVSQDRGMAELFGVDVKRIELLTVLTSLAAATGAGSMIVLDGAATNIDSCLLTVASAFAAAVVGGLKSIPRAAGAGFFAGAATAMWSDFFSPVYAASAVFAILLFLLAFSSSRGGTPGITEKI